MSNHSLPVFTLRCIALQLAIAGASIGAAALLPSVAFAQQQEQQEQQEQQQEFVIAAGSLDEVLGRFAAQAGVSLSIDADRTRGMQSSGLQGTYSVNEGFKQLLRGSGLQAVQQANGTYTLQKAPAMGQLKTVKVTGSALDDNIEGVYTVPSASSATGLAISLRETPQSISIVTQQMIEDQALVDIGQVLEHVPGFSQVGDSSEDSMIYVRGFRLNDNSIQVDGMLATTASNTYAGALSQGMDAAAIERVEVVKGAAGILGGLGEPSATVNMIRKRPTDNFQGSLSLSGGSWNSWRAESDVAGPLDEDGSLRGRFVGALMDGDSYVDRYHRQGDLLYGILDKTFNQRTKLSLAIDSVTSDYDGVYHYSSNPAYFTDGSLIDHNISFSTGQKWAYRNVSERSVMPEVEHLFENGWTLRSAYRYAEGKINLLDAHPGAYVDPDTLEFISAWGSPNALKLDQTTDTQSFNILVTGSFALGGRDHEAVFGYNNSRNDFKMKSNNYELPSITLNQLEIPAPDLSQSTSYYANRDRISQGGIFGTLRFSLTNHLKLMAGGRVSSWDFEFSDLDTGERKGSAEAKDIVTPYFGIVYELNSFASIYASHTGIFLPTSNFGADGNVLEPTEGTNNELGVKLAFYDDRLNISAAVYESNNDNVPEWANLGRLPNGQWIYKSINGISTEGYEIEIAGELSPNWQISAGYTQNTAEDLDGNKRTTYMPDDVFKLSTNYDLVKVKPGFVVGASVRWQSDSYMDTEISAVDTSLPIRQEQPSYWLVDLMARYPVSDSFTLSANFNNLLDERYNRSLWGYADYGEPRNFSLKARWKF